MSKTMGDESPPASPAVATTSRSSASGPRRKTLRTYSFAADSARRIQNLFHSLCEPEMASDNSSQELRDNYPYQFGDETEQRKKQRQTSHRYDRLASGRGEEHRHASQQRKYSSVIGKSCGLSPAVVTLAVDSLLDVYLVPCGLWKLFEMRPPAQQFRRCDIPAPRPRGTLNCSNQAKPHCP